VPFVASATISRAVAETEGPAAAPEIVDGLASHDVAAQDASATTARRTCDGLALSLIYSYIGI
jgi:hypothetical protein